MALRLGEDYRGSDTTKVYRDDEEYRQPHARLTLAGKMASQWVREQSKRFLSGAEPELSWLLGLSAAIPGAPGAMRQTLGHGCAL